MLLRSFPGNGREHGLAITDSDDRIPSLAETECHSQMLFSPPQSLSDS